eukprot:PhF_6_TR5224/c0_g1_i1/m.7542
MNEIVYASYGGHNITERMQLLSKTVIEFAGTPDAKLKWSAGQYVAVLGFDPYPNEYKTFVVVSRRTERTVITLSVNTYDDDQDFFWYQYNPIPSDPRNNPPVASSIVEAVYISNNGIDNLTSQLSDEFRTKKSLLETVPAGTSSSSSPSLLLCDYSAVLVVVYTSVKHGVPYRGAAFWFPGEFYVVGMIPQAASSGATMALLKR